jgi:phage terminase small subunit
LTNLNRMCIINAMSLPATRKLTEKQQSFLDNLIETKGNLKLSAELAGYSGNHYQIIKSLRQEIVDLASDVLAREAPTAAFKLVDVMQSETAIPQANVKLQAAQTILDRVGLGKQDRMEVNHNVGGGIFILPEKQVIDIEAEDGDYEDISD